ncbi:MAG: hypothetical protein HXX18_01100 [Bacteroidetes bacterium]|nr:hypothetical protein [Bacteroidota bacterium]
MYIIIDYRIPDEAKINLAKYGQIIEFKTEGITYNAISSHPDIFFCQTSEKLIIASNTPSYIISFFQKKKIEYIIGKKEIGFQYPQSSHYNAVVTDKFLIHNSKHTDEKIVESCSFKTKLSVNQGYTRCNLISLGQNNFITSDKGICNQLQTHLDINIKYTNPNKILLPNVNNGFFGGCCGISRDKLFILGNLEYLADGLSIKEFATSLGFKIVELYDGLLYDGGGILFIDA